MKNLFIAVLLLTSCSKQKLPNNIQGVWAKEKARFVGMEKWENFPSSEPLVVITDDSISSPWNSKYTIKDNSTIIINGDFVKVSIKKNEMLWSLYGDSLVFIR